jgi:tetratricopeptide (TPR) repeat protein
LLHMKVCVCDYLRATKVFIFFFSAYNEGVYFHRMKMLDRAVDSYLRATRLKHELAEAHLNAGTIFLTALKYDDALRHFSWGYDVADTRALRSDALSNIGLIYKDTSEKDATRLYTSLDYFFRALVEVPDHPDALYNCGAVLDVLGDSMGAKLLYEKARTFVCFRALPMNIRMSKLFDSYLCASCFPPCPLNFCRLFRSDLTALAQV